MVTQRPAQAFIIITLIVAADTGTARLALTITSTAPAIAPNHQAAPTPQTRAMTTGDVESTTFGWWTVKYSTATLAVTISSAIPRAQARSTHSKTIWALV